MIIGAGKIWTGYDLRLQKIMAHPNLLGQNPIINR